MNTFKLFSIFSVIVLTLFSCTKNPVNNEEEDGERILFIRSSREFSEICTMKPDGSDLKVIAHHDYNEEYIRQGYYYAQWSPDKSKIAVEGGPKHTLEYCPIWIMDNDGNLLYKLTWNGGRAIWLPDGEKIIFSRRKGYFSSIDDLYIINSNGQNERVLVETENRSRFSTDCSKDGNKILITETYVYYDSSGKLYCDSPEIAFLDILTKEIEYLTQNEVQDYLPRWSLDENKILFVSGLYKKADIFVLDLKDKTIKNITEAPDSYQDPIWDPDDSKIIYSKPIDDFSQDIYLLNLGNMKSKNLTVSCNDSVSNFAVDWK